MSQQEVHFQIMWNRLVSILEEQAMTLIRTAFSTSVREAGDLSAGVFDRHGRMVAQAVTGTPGHVNTMAAAVPHFINDIGPERIYPGDIYLTNDPWKGTGHLHDITVTTPVFVKDELIGFFAATATELAAPLPNGFVGAAESFGASSPVCCSCTHRAPDRRAPGIVHEADYGG